MENDRANFSFWISASGALLGVLIYRYAGIFWALCAACAWWFLVPFLKTFCVKTENKSSSDYDPLANREVLTMEDFENFVAVSDGDVVLVKSGQSFNFPSDVGAGTKQLLEKYESVAIPLQGIEISRALLSGSKYQNDGISIGHAEDWDIVIFPGKEAVYLIESGIDDSIKFNSVFDFLVSEIDKLKTQ